MAAGAKALHNILLRAQRLDGVDHLFSSTVSLTLVRNVAKAGSSQGRNYIAKNVIGSCLLRARNVD